MIRTDYRIIIPPNDGCETVEVAGSRKFSITQESTDRGGYVYRHVVLSRMQAEQLLIDLPQLLEKTK